MLRSLLLYLSELEAPKKFLTQSSLGRKLARRFIAGEELADALGAIRQLNNQGFEVTLDYLGESVRDVSAAEEACQAYLTILDRLSAEGLRSHVSVKLTQLGMAMDEAVAERHLRAIAQRARLHANFVRIDMEGSPYTEITLRLFQRVDAPRDVLGIALQSYLYRSERDVDNLLQCSARIRLVKGAYKEPPGVAFPRKEDVDGNFQKLMEKLLASGGYHAVATHDRRMIDGALGIARCRGLGADRFEFQMLYGIRRQLQRELLRQGYRVRVYVPYGKQWYPYFMRRLAERPANLVFLLSNLLRE